MDSDMYSMLEVERQRELNKYSSNNNDKKVGDGVEFRKWFMRGVALTLAFILTSGVFTLAGGFVFKQVVENKIEKTLQNR